MKCDFRTFTVVDFMQWRVFEKLVAGVIIREFFHQLEKRCASGKVWMHSQNFTLDFLWALRN